ncbi:MAG: metal-dependent transcriptional regulator [Candidatus Latescibacteria bacterium]|nr:metal-dependent transcriptional regulator [Candidatus Latescibacterota bacterium]
MPEQQLSASQEDYLEAISHVIDEKRVARSKDLVQRLGVNSSSVTQALRILSQKDLIHYEPYGVVTLTTAGELLARDVIRRHKALNAFFVRILGVDDATAEDAACKMEHAMPRVIVERLVQFIDYTERCPRGSAEWVEDFGYFCRAKSEHDPHCQACELISPPQGPREA